MELSNYIDTIPDFPQEGIAFKDITPLLRDQAAYSFALERIEEEFSEIEVDYIAGIEARGFIFASALADRMHCGFIPVRKGGKLPGNVITQKYDLEYGTAVLEIRKDCVPLGARVLIVDDVLATGGTALCAANLFHEIGADLLGFAFVISLSFLSGEQKLDSYKTVTLVRYE